MREMPRKRFSRTSKPRKVLEGLALGLVIAGIGLAALLTKAMDGLEAKTWDMRVASFAKPSAASDSIKLIFLDQESLDWARLENKQGWPWPREYYATVLRFLNRSQTKAISFDVLFSEPSYVSVEDDGLLAAEAKKSDRFISSFFLGGKKNQALGDKDSQSVPIKPKPPLFQFDGLAELQKAAPALDASFPIPEVADNATMLADTFGTPDSDGIYRRTRLFTAYNGQAYPSLASAAWLVGTGSTTVGFQNRQFSMGQAVPVDDQGRLLIRYRGPSQTHQAYTVREIIRSELLLESGEKPSVDPAEFNGKYVFFGFTAPALFDLRPTPISPNFAGVEVYATVLDNLLSGDFLREVDSRWSLAYLFALAICAGVFIRLSHKAWQSIAVILAFMSVPIALAWALYQPGYWLPVVVPELTVFLTLIGGFALNYASEGRQKRFIKGAFSQYLSPEVIERLVENPELLILGGEKRESSILFSDIRGFTSISEKLDPEELTALLNEYLSEMTTIIYNHGGTIDKYEGDAIIAFWNAPLDLPDHGINSVRAALEYQKRLAEIRPMLKEKAAGQDVFTRIGINSGPVVIGNMGSAQRFNYTFFGDAGNLASRLEGLNKQFGTFTMVSEHTKDLAGPVEDIHFRELSRVAVVGKSLPVTVFEPMYRQEADAKSDILGKFAKGLQLYYDGTFKEALAVMRELAPIDPPAAHYVAKLEELIANPPPNWKGVWVSTEK